MHEVFDEDELQPDERRRDTEVTLGPIMLLGIFFGLVLLCGLCFGLGYSMGSRGSHDSPVASQQPGAQASWLATLSRPKPSAAPQNIPQPQRAVVDLPPSEASGAGPGLQNPGSTSAPGANS